MLLSLLGLRFGWGPLVPTVPSETSSHAAGHRRTKRSKERARTY